MATFESAGHGGLEEILDEYLAAQSTEVLAASFGVAGPVQNGRSEPVNLEWGVDAAEVAEALDLPEVGLINDLEANAYGIAALDPRDIAVLNEGDPDVTGNIAVISAGTGLGEAGLIWDGKTHRPFATEGGHADFAPQPGLQVSLHSYIAATYGHASYERVCSGTGLANIYWFLGGGRADPALISHAALSGADEVAVAALDLMVSIYGAEAGNFALKLMARGGVSLGGGIAPQILPKLHDGTFMRAFTDKGRSSSLLERIPVRVILNDRTALLGAARHAAETWASRPEPSMAGLR